MTSETAAPRLVTVGLHSGAQITGDLVATSGVVHTLRVEDRRVEVSLVEIASLADAPSALTGDETTRPLRPIAIDVHLLAEDDRGADVRRVLASRARIEAGAREIGEGLTPPPPVHVYAVLDGARAPYLLGGLEERGETAPHCLYSGPLSDEDAELAPYLVALPTGSPVLEWLSDAGWGEQWGIYLLSPAKPDVLVRHLRSFLRVCAADGAGLGFRF